MSTSGGKLSTSATTPILHALDSTILPALNLAKAGVTGLGVPGVEPIINGVLELGKMVLAMKANKEDLARLDEFLKELIAIDVSATSDDLKTAGSGIVIKSQANRG
ncbi:hypothetical protein B0H13DRAFT_1920490 [Mycena leptocephala]|nr:hypothetical protein B0H13DRAFT_1920490 [Mycena leptocephala]